MTRFSVSSSGRSLCAIAFLALLLFILALGLSADEAKAWEDVSTKSITGECGYAYKYTSTSTYYYNYKASSPYLGYYGYRSSSSVYTYWYEAWYKFPLYIVDNRTYIDSATLTISEERR